MFSVGKIENGFLFQDNATGQVTSYRDEKTLVRGIREYLGLPTTGRPKIKREVYNGLEETEEEG